MSPGPIQLDQATALTLMLGPNGSVGIQASLSDGRDARDLRRLYKDALGVVVGSLLRVLMWREKDIACAANASRIIGAEHAVLASKHPVKTGARLLLGALSAEMGELGISYPVYVSHPISRPRRDRLSKGVWPPFVEDLDAVVTTIAQEAESDCHVIPIIPTAIDEFRILDDGTYLHPCLTPRWSLLRGDLLFSLPNAPGLQYGSYQDYQDYETRGLPLVFDPPLDQYGRRVGFAAI